MNKWGIGGAAGFAAMMVVAGCGKAGSTADGYVPQKPKEVASTILPPGQEAEYFPVAVGNQWTFQATNQQAVGTRQTKPLVMDVTYKITAVQPVPGGGKDAFIQVLDDTGKVVDRQQWRITSKGLYQIAVGPKLSRFSVPQLVLPFPVKTGQKFTWAGSLTDEKGKTRTGKQTSTVGAQEPIDTMMPSGAFSALAIATTGTLETSDVAGKIVNTTWFIPHVGLGRYFQQLSGETKKNKTKVASLQKLVLKSYSLKK